VEEIAGFKEMFEMMDINKNGNLTLKELNEGLQNLGSLVGHSDVQMLMEAVSELFPILPSVLFEFACFLSSNLLLFYARKYVLHRLCFFFDRRVLMEAAL